MPRILGFLTRAGYVNVGFVAELPRPLPFSPTNCTSGKGNKVVIVGAGPSALAAAYHLRNFGYNVSACFTDVSNAESV